MMKKLCAWMLMVTLLCGCMVIANADQSEAKNLGRSVIGRYVWITKDANVRAAAAEESSSIARVYQGSEYQVLGYDRNGDTGNYWYLIEWQYGWYGWVSASMADTTGYQYSPDGIGYCIVTGNGVRGRSGAGTSYSQVANCIRGNGFRVYDSRKSGGTTWYQISIDGIRCWIGSGLANFYAY